MWLCILSVDLAMSASISYCRLALALGATSWHSNGFNQE